MPLLVAGRFGVLEHGSNAVDDLVNAEVVFERVVAADVVVLLVLGPPDHAAAAVEFAGDGPEPDAQVNVLVARSLGQGDVEGGIVVLGFLVEDFVGPLLGDFPLPTSSVKPLAIAPGSSDSKSQLRLPRLCDVAIPSEIAPRKEGQSRGPTALAACSWVGLRECADVRLKG